MELKDLTGVKILDAVDFSTESIKNLGDYYEDCDVCRFRLDGIVYVVIEDPEDGYRSSMKDLFVDENATMKNIFTGIEVLCRHIRITDDIQDNDILEIVDTETGKIVLEVGTANTNDYYPWFVAKFHPEAMCLNS